MSEPWRTWPVSVLPIRRGSELAEDPHHPQGLQTHLAEILRPLLTLVHAGEGLDLLADLAIAGQVVGLKLSRHDPSGGLQFRTKVFRLLPLVHQPGRLEGDLASQPVARHY